MRRRGWSSRPTCAYKLREAGVRVTAARFQGSIDDFVMLNALATSAATRGAMSLANAWLRSVFNP